MNRRFAVDFVLFIVLEAIIILMSCRAYKKAEMPTEEITTAEETTIEETAETTENQIEKPTEETAEEETTEMSEEREPLYRKYDIVALAKLVEGEAGALDKLEKSCVIWNALNYVDKGETIQEAIKHKNRYSGYHDYNKVTDENIELVIDVLQRWEREKNGEEDVGRTLPKEYLFFRGFKWTEKAKEYGLSKPKKSHNWFFTKKEYEKGKYERSYWDFSINPYES